MLLVGGYLFLGVWMKNRHAGTEAVAAQPQNSIAVLPFLDLTEGMSNEEFADGMTEELIDKLSKIPGLRVPSATASFYFKNKQVPLGDMAQVGGGLHPGWKRTQSGRQGARSSAPGPPRKWLRVLCRKPTTGRPATFYGCRTISPEK